MKANATASTAPPDEALLDQNELELLAAVYKTAGLNPIDAEQAAQADLVALYPEPRMVCCCAA